MASYLDEETLAVRKRVLGPQHPDTLRSMHNLAATLSNQGQFEEALKLHEETVATRKRVLGPEHPDTLRSRTNLTITCAKLAESLTTCADLKSRDPARAMELAKRAVEMDPASTQAWQVLGWAKYRTGAWKASIESLQKSMQLQDNPKGGDSFQWFFLAMAHWQLGQKDEARKWYDEAVQWMEKNKPQGRVLEQLGRFRTEAEELMGIKKKEGR